MPVRVVLSLAVATAPGMANMLVKSVIDLAGSSLLGGLGVTIGVARFTLQNLVDRTDSLVWLLVSVRYLYDSKQSGLR